MKIIENYRGYAILQTSTGYAISLADKIFVERFKSLDACKTSIDEDCFTHGD